MKSIASRSLAFGVVVASLFLGLTIAALYIGGWLGQPYLQWPFFAFLAGGAPLSWLIQQIPGVGLSWLPNPGDGPVGSAMSELFFAGCVTWPLLIGAALYWVLKRRGPAPNNSSKPTPLRGAA